MKRRAIHSAARCPAHLELEAMALEIPDVAGHPNRVPFSGVLTRVDEPSDRAPAGAAGHRVLLPRETAERALASLLGMGVDFAPGLRGHDVRRKIGIITGAEIRESRLEVSGYFFGKDFPDAVREIRARRERLGMSYEVTGVRVADPAAEVWRLENIVFTGAAVLDRSAAAYQETSLAAGAAGAPAPSHSEFRGDNMSENMNQTLTLLAQASQALAAEVAGLRGVLEEQRATQAALARLLEEQAAERGEARPLETRVAELSRATEELERRQQALRAQGERFSVQAMRKTLPPQVMTLLAKSGVPADAVGANGQLDIGVLDKALESLPVEQRMAIKSQLARAGAIL
jgi:hypothetical protein